MGDWSSEQYLKFAGPRLRPGLDLLARVPLDEPGTVYDLGCGPGNLTAFLKKRWPGATVAGIDNSPDMIARAGAADPDGNWIEGDIAAWAPDRPADLVFSNACLHWLGDHDVLMPALARHLRPGGVLAVQMPRNWSQPSHRAMEEAAGAGPWEEQVRPALLGEPVGDPAFYYDLLAPLSRSLDIWEADYLQVLEGDNPVAEWTKGTALRPLLDALEEPERREFFEVYSKLVQAAYRKRPDGRTLFPFRRLFIVAERS